MFRVVPFLHLCRFLVLVECKFNFQPPKSANSISTMRTSIFYPHLVLVLVSLEGLVVSILYNNCIILFSWYTSTSLAYYNSGLVYGNWRLVCYSFRLFCYSLLSSSSLSSLFFWLLLLVSIFINIHYRTSSNTEWFSCFLFIFIFRS